MTYCDYSNRACRPLNTKKIETTEKINTHGPVSVNTMNNKLNNTACFDSTTKKKITQKRTDLGNFMLHFRFVTFLSTSHVLQCLTYVLSRVKSGAYLL